MKQQDFWTWADKEAARETGTAGGRLFLSELPTDLGLSLPKIQKLHKDLQDRLGSVDLVLTDNRRRMVSARHRRKGFRLRVHHMFVGCSKEVVDALAVMASGKKERSEGDSRQILKDYISTHRDAISYEVDPGKLEARGEHHDLQAMLDKWRARMDAEILADVVITWGRYGKGSRTIRFGSFDFDRKLIRMHPALDQSWVPDFFVEFIVYHELLHALFPPQKKSSRRIVHPPEFRQMEERFPRYEEAMIWEKKNLSRFMEG